jgi:hypothetical protein
MRREQPEILPNFRLNLDNFSKIMYTFEKILVVKLNHYHLEKEFDKTFSQCLESHFRVKARKNLKKPNKVSTIKEYHKIELSSSL